MPAVLVCAYLAAVHLNVAARRQGAPALERWFRDRALLASVLTGAVSVVGIFVLRQDAPRLFHRLSHRALALVVVAALCGVATVLLLLRDRRTGLRALATAAVALVVLGWGVAQYPCLLGTHLQIPAAGAPEATLKVTIGVAIVAGLCILPSTALLILPSTALLLVLSGRGRLQPAPQEGVPGPPLRDS
ncbi:cytochrome d ubiquinol oxidase subunit II [Streptomyces sp. NPDC002172]